MNSYITGRISVTEKTGKKQVSEYAGGNRHIKRQTPARRHRYNVTVDAAGRQPNGDPAELMLWGDM